VSRRAVREGGPSSFGRDGGIKIRARAADRGGMHTIITVVDYVATLIQILPFPYGKG
jgi:hypothetical protein